MILKITPDLEKAKSFFKLAQESFEKLLASSFSKYPSSSLKEYYDALHFIFEGISSSLGVKVKGEGAHAELINFICKTFSISEGERQFLQTLRDYRNKISYEGLAIPKEFMQDNKNELKDMFFKFSSLLEEKIK
jgi:hypothetical protein